MNEKNINPTDNKTLEKMGFKCGLEIHQQLNTKTKLFCHCPVGLTNERHDAEILRHMRPTLSELGEYDGTALMEFKTKKEVIYQLYRFRTCTYEMDDTPPFLINQEAINIAIQLSLLFNCKIIDELHVIRKQYLDGSIPTGFQRTLIIGVDGWIPYKDRKISIPQVNLEEEACREVSDKGHQIVFATDRLSIPLVEIITGAEMKNPDEATEVCRILGNAMKITGLVRRGIGTVRQDVNVSVTGGERVEIKGVYKVGNIRSLTAIEAVRQKRLLELRQIFREQFTTTDLIAYRDINVTEYFRDTGCVIGRRLESDQPLKVMALLLPSMVDIISYALQPSRNFAFELSGRVRVIACIDSIPNLFFYSEREKYDIPESIWKRIWGDIDAAGTDDIVVVCGPSEDVGTAVDEIKLRISELAQGIPNETRQDLKDGTTDFERILPGPDRMYPDTDHPPIRVTHDRVEELRSKVAEPLWEKQERWRTMNLHTEQVKALSLSPFADLFDKLTAENEIGRKKTAHIVTAMFVGLRRRGYDLQKCSSAVLFDAIKSSVINKWPYRKLKSKLIQLADGIELTEAADPKITDDSLNDIFNNVKLEFNGRNKSGNGDKFKRFLIGKLMDKYSNSERILSKINKKIASEL